MKEEEYLRAHGCDVRKNYSASCTYGSKFMVRTAVFPRDFTAAVKAEEVCRGACFLGGASNVLPLGELPLAVFTGGVRGMIANGRTLYVMGGEKLSSVCRYACALELSGMEQLCGIPGSIGGAAAGNSGCFGREMSDITLYVDVSVGGRVERVYAKDAGFAYRACALKGRGLIVGAMLELAPGDREKIEENMRVWQSVRASSQPGRPSLGSTFKRAGDISAAYYIEKDGFKGARQGGAQVSEQHAGFIVNTGGGTAEDYYILAEKVRAGAEKRLGVKLEYEVDIVAERGLYGHA